MAKGFYLKSAFRNIWNGKKQSFIYFLGIFISITVVTSLSIWSVTAEDVSVKDFMEAQDFELRVRSYLPERLPDIKEWLDEESLVESSSFIHYNLAFFNAEDKTPFYRFFPLDNQENMSDPVGLSTLFLIDNITAPRIASQFNYEGSFDLQEGEVLISRTIANQLEGIYNKTIEPGIQVNLSICKQSTDFGLYLFQYEPEHFYNITIKGIYEIIPGITMLQSSFSQDFIDTSIIFLRDNLAQEHVDRMESNGLTPILVVKLDSDKITDDGADEIMPKIEQLIISLEIEQSTSLPYILDAPIDDLKQSFNKAKNYMLVLLPVVILGVIQALFTTNIVIEHRKTEIIILKERGGQKLQIIGTFILEFFILALIGIIISSLSSIILASLIPGLTPEGLTWEGFTSFLGSLKIQYIPVIITILSALIVTLIYASIRINQILTYEISEREQKFRGKVQKGILLGILIVATVGSIAALIIFGIIYQLELADVFNYSIEDTQKGTILFILIIIVTLLLSICVSLLVTFILGKINWTKILNKDGFFISNNFKNSDHKFSSIILILLIVCTTAFFSFTQLATLKINEQNTEYYNNGSDLRIHTKDIHHLFTTNLSTTTGVDDAMAVMKSSGQYGLDLVTLYGVNATKFSDIGRWDSSSFSNELEIIDDIYKDFNYESWLARLPLYRNGTIISDSLAKKFELEIGETITLSTIPFGGRYGNDEFYIVGIMHSAPGLGLTDGVNLALDQPNAYYMLVNDWKFYEDYRINNTNLFFANLNNNANLEDVENNLKLNEKIVDVNPSLEYVSFGELFVNKYLPPIQIFIYIQIVLTLLIGSIIIISNIDFILSQRKPNNAILFALGNPWKGLLRTILSELAILSSAVIFFGSIIAFPMVAISNLLAKSFLLDKLILPLNYTINYLSIILVCIGILVIPLLATLPVLLKSRNEKIANIIYQITY